MEDLREENYELEEKIKQLNEKILVNPVTLNDEHQGLGTEGYEQFTKNLVYGNLQPHEIEFKQA